VKNEDSRKPPYNARKHVGRSWHCLWSGSTNWVFLDRCWSTSINSKLDSIEEQRRIRLRTQYALKVLGVVVCLIGAVLMFDGSLLGERTIGLATLAVIAGISLIASSARKLRG
jgi:hypothetical protein